MNNYIYHLFLNTNLMIFLFHTSTLTSPVEIYVSTAPQCILAYLESII